MTSFESIHTITVSLDVDGNPSLFVLLSEDGSVNRMGTGTVDNAERDLFIGLTVEPLFAELRDKLRPEWMPFQGAYDIPEKAGSRCALTILLRNKEDQEVGFHFTYGSESEGPFIEICEFVAEAVRLTDPWYEEQKLIAGRRYTTNR